MRRKCGRSDQPAVSDLVGPRLCGGDDAARALRLSYGAHGKESIIVLVCDRDRRIVLAVDFEGAPAYGAAAVLECVVPAVPPLSSVVVGLFRPGRSTTLDPWDLDAVREMAARCEEEGITVLDVIVLNDFDWSSVPDVADGW